MSRTLPAHAQTYVGHVLRTAGAAHVTPRVIAAWTWASIALEEMETTEETGMTVATARQMKGLTVETERTEATEPMRWSHLHVQMKLRLQHLMTLYLAQLEQRA